MNDQITQKMTEHMSRLVALQLWKLGAVKVSEAEPFRLASGNFSPVYINCRQLISAPAFVDLFAASARILCDQRGIRFDVIAGGETAGIPFAAFLARSFGSSMIYVRKEAKSHGIASRIEGVLTPKTRVLLVEDLITDAGSKLSFVEAIREAGATIEEVLVIFDRLQGGQEALAHEGIRLHAITDMNMVLQEAESAEILSSEGMKSVQDYLQSPREWHARMGLAFKG